MSIRPSSSNRTESTHPKRRVKAPVLFRLPNVRIDGPEFSRSDSVDSDGTTSAAKPSIESATESTLTNHERAKLDNSRRDDPQASSDDNARYQSQSLGPKTSALQAATLEDHSHSDLNSQGSDTAGENPHPEIPTRNEESKLQKSWSSGVMLFVVVIAVSAAIYFGKSDSANREAPTLADGSETNANEAIPIDISNSTSATNLVGVVPSQNRTGQPSAKLSADARERKSAPNAELPQSSLPQEQPTLVLGTSNDPHEETPNPSTKATVSADRDPLSLITESTNQVQTSTQPNGLDEATLLSSDSEPTSANLNANRETEMNHRTPGGDTLVASSSQSASPMMQPTPSGDSFSTGQNMVANPILAQDPLASEQGNISETEFAQLDILELLERRQALQLSQANGSIFNPRITPAAASIDSANVRSTQSPEFRMPTSAPGAPGYQTNMQNQQNIQTNPLSGSAQGAFPSGTIPQTTTGNPSSAVPSYQPIFDTNQTPTPVYQPIGPGGS